VQGTGCRVAAPLPPGYREGLDAGCEAIATGGTIDAEAMHGMHPIDRRIMTWWLSLLNPHQLVMMEDTFLAPAILARRRAAASAMQNAYRRYVAVNWKRHAVSARKVQRAWRRLMTRKCFMETIANQVGAEARLQDALKILEEEMAALEARCQPPEGEAVTPGLRALALIRGRVVDGCTVRLRQLVELAVKKQTPEALERPAVQAIVAQATHGLFPDHDDAARFKHATSRSVRVEARKAPTAGYRRATVGRYTRRDTSPSSSHRAR